MEKEIVKQRTSFDCAVCCLAMATGETYEAIVRNLPLEAVQDLALQVGFTLSHDITLLEKLGFDWDGLYTENGYKPKEKRKAILMVPSKNQPGKKHAVYYDGEEVLDPSTKLKYTTQEALSANEYAIELL